MILVVKVIPSPHFELGLLHEIITLMLQKPRMLQIQGVEGEVTASKNSISNARS